MKGTAEVSQPKNFKNALPLTWNSKNVLLWGRGFVSWGNKGLWIHSRLVEIRFDRGRSLKILDTDIKN